MTTTTSTSRRSSSSGHAVAIRCSTRGDGDFHLHRQSLDRLERRRRAFVDLPWTMADQRHGVDVLRVDAPGVGDRVAADVLITDRPDTVLACWAADCAPLVLIGSADEFAVVHAGWRGLAAGIVDVAVAAFGEPVAELALGPAIGPCCYEFGDRELELVADGVHATPDELRSLTSDGRPALDVGAAVRSAAAHHGIGTRQLAGCTGCDHDGFSYRVRRDPQRHVVAAWRPGGRA